MILLSDIYKKIRSGYYDCTELTYPRRTEKCLESYVTDENKSVKWNREQVKLEQKKYAEASEKFNYELRKRKKEFYDNLTNYLIEEGLKRKVSEKIIEQARGECDSKEEIVFAVDEYKDFILEIIELNNE